MSVLTSVFLSKHLGKDALYVGIDLSERADVKIDLEKDDLAFKDESFFLAL